MEEFEKEVDRIVSGLAWKLDSGNMEAKKKAVLDVAERNKEAILRIKKDNVRLFAEAIAHYFSLSDGVKNFNSITAIFELGLVLGFMEKEKDESY
jgi:hypothetical protein